MRQAPAPASRSPRLMRRAGTIGSGVLAVLAMLCATCARGNPTNATQGSRMEIWHLAGSLHREGETIEERDPDRREPMLAAWLAGDDRHGSADAARASGLELVIGADGRFTERRTGDARIRWYDEGGVETIAEAVPFDGYAVERGGHRYLRPALDPQAMSVRLKRDERFPGIALRIDDGDTDDGDTLVADRIDRDGDRLLRTMSVVTDEAYLSRLTLVYQRQPAP